jgi:hypothetical protein
VLGVPIPQASHRLATRCVTTPAAQTRPPEPPFTLTDADRRKVHEARFAWTDAFHAGEPIVDDIVASLGLDRETLRRASWGSSGLGLAQGWLCYRYPHGLKWRNPDANAKPRFVWLVGKATAPWRMEWVKPETPTVAAMLKGHAAEILTWQGAVGYV